MAQAHGAASALTLDDRLPLTEVARRDWGQVAIALMAVVGLGISIYLTIVHYDTKVTLACTTGGIVNCGNVTTSAYSVVPFTQIPVTIPGMLWFLISGALALIALRSLWQLQPEPSWLRPAQIVWSVGGMLFVLYLVYCELVLVHNICEWCTAVHILTLATLLIVLGSGQPDLEPMSVSAARRKTQMSAAEPAPPEKLATRPVAVSRRVRKQINRPTASSRSSRRT